MAVVETQNDYPASGESYPVTILRVYMSHESRDISALATVVARELETELDVLGSTRHSTIGRWRDSEEPGVMIELSYQGNSERDISVLKRLREELDLTFYVTATNSTAMEIY